MEAVYSSKTFVHTTYKSARRHNPEDHHRQNLVLFFITVLSLNDEVASKLPEDCVVRNSLCEYRH
jgi:hypothetical protein